MGNKWQKKCKRRKKNENLWGLEDESSLSLLVHGTLQRSKSNPPQLHQLGFNWPSMSQISSNTMRLAGLEETAGTVWSLLIQNGWTGRALKFTLPSTFLSHRFSTLGLKWDNWNANTLLFSSFNGWNLQMGCLNSQHTTHSFVFASLSQTRWRSCP